MRISATALYNGKVDTHVHDLTAGESILYGSPDSPFILTVAVTLEAGEYMVVYSTERPESYLDDGPVVDFFDLESAGDAL